MDSMIFVPNLVPRIRPFCFAQISSIPKSREDTIFTALVAGLFGPYVVRAVILVAKKIRTASCGTSGPSLQRALGPDLERGSSTAYLIFVLGLEPVAVPDQRIAATAGENSPR